MDSGNLKGSKMSSICNLMNLLKCFKILSILILISLFIREMAISYFKFSRNLISTSIYSQSEPTFSFPSFAVCITMDKSFSGGYKSTHWMNPEKYNITFPFEELGFITDTGAFSNINLTGKLNMNDPDTLKKLNLTWSDVWEVKILGEFSEPIRCYLYHPVGTRKTGFTQSFGFRLRVSQDPSIAYYFAVFNKNAFIPNVSRMFGLDFHLTYASTDKTMRYYGVEVNRQNFTDLSTTTKPCSEWSELEKGPGFTEYHQVESRRVVKTVDDCYTDFFHSKLGCRLPWVKGGTLEPCNTSQQYDLYRKLIGVWDDSGEDEFYLNTGCIHKCSYRKFAIRPLFDSNFDSLAYTDQIVDNATLQVKFFFTAPVIDIVDKIIVYDLSDFFSDFGGFIGLFLGASCLTLIDLIAVYVERSIGK